jgi:hypothetical protein
MDSPSTRPAATVRLWRGDIKSREQRVRSPAQWRRAVALRGCRARRRSDRRPDAQRELEAVAGDDFSTVPRHWLWLMAMAALSEVVAFLHDSPRAKRLHELLLPYADRCVVIEAPFCHGSASRPLGLLATTVGGFDTAAQHFEHALEFNTRIKSPLWVAHIQHDRHARPSSTSGSPLAASGGGWRDRQARPC